MQVADSRMIASVGFWMVGSARSSTWTSPGAVITATRMDRLLDVGQTPGPAGTSDPAAGIQPTSSRADEEVSLETCTDRAPQAARGRPHCRRCGRAKIREFGDHAVIQLHSAREVGLPRIGATPAIRKHLEQICYAVRLLGEDRRKGA